MLNDEKKINKLDISQMFKKIYQNIGWYVYRWLESIGHLYFLTLLVLFSIFLRHLSIIISPFFSKINPDGVRELKKASEELDDWAKYWMDFDKVAVGFASSGIILVICLIIGSL